MTPEMIEQANSPESRLKRLEGLNFTTSVRTRKRGRSNTRNRPKGTPPSWMDFILDDHTPGKLRATTSSGGFFEGMDVTYFGMDETGEFYRVFNRCDNQVWAHRAMFEVVEKPRLNCAQLPR
jgi:hypothetical protein